MYMISRFIFEAAYKAQGHLSIEPYEPSYHIRNFYYFRLGGLQGPKDAEPITESLVVPAGGFLRIWSLERFKLSDRVLGLFGSLSALISRGLELIHSPSIGPGFEGSLELGLRNNLNEVVTLEPQDRIGQILFFDCAETFAGAEEFMENVLKAKELEERRKAGEAMLRAYSEFTEGKKTE